MNRRGWIEAAKRVVEDPEARVQCPNCGYRWLNVEFLPFSEESGGEYRLSCPACGEENFVLVRKTPPEAVDGEC